MSDNYDIQFSNGNITFTVAPYTTNGPQTPIVNDLDERAGNASTSLLIYGKSTDDYGDRIQENLIHLLENFTAPVEPTYPINGQMWFNETSRVLSVFDAANYPIIANRAPNIGQINVITIAGDYLSRLLSLDLIRIFYPGGYKDYTMTDRTYDTVNDETYFTVSPTPLSSQIGNTLGGWNSIMVGTDTGSLDLENTYKIINLKTSLITDPGDVANREFVLNQIGVSISNFDLDDLTDVTITTPANGNIIVYDSASPSLWVNKTPIEAGVLSLSGTGASSMSGDIDMGGYIVKLARSTTPYDHDQTLVTKDYVDALGGPAAIGARILPELLDVEVTNPAPFDVLMFQGDGNPLDVWENVTKEKLPQIARVLPIEGSNYVSTDITFEPIMSGPLILSFDHDVGNPDVANNLLKAVSVGYLHSQIEEGKDGYVEEATFDYFNGQISFRYSRPVDSGETTYDFFADVRQMNHCAEDPRTTVARNYLFETDREVSQNLSGESIYPRVPIGNAMHRISRAVGNLMRVRDREYGFVSDVSTYATDFEFPVGYNVISAYLDGSRLVSSTRGFSTLKVDLTQQSPSPPMGILGTNLVAEVEGESPTTYEAFIVDGDQSAMVQEGNDFEVYDSCNDGCTLTNDGTYLIKAVNYFPAVEGSPDDNIEYTEIVVDPAVPVVSPPYKSNIAYGSIDNGTIKTQITNSNVEIWGGHPLWSDWDLIKTTLFGFEITLPGNCGIESPCLSPGGSPWESTARVIVNPAECRTMADFMEVTNGYHDAFKIHLQDGKVYFYSSTPGDGSQVIISDGVAGGSVTEQAAYRQSGGEDPLNPGFVNPGAENWIRVDGKDVTQSFTSGITFDVGVDVTVNTPLTVQYSEYDGANTTIHVEEIINAVQDVAPVATAGTLTYDVEDFFASLTGGHYYDSGVPGYDFGVRNFFYRFDPADLTEKESMGITGNYEEVGVWGGIGRELIFVPSVTGMLEVIADNAGI